MDKEIVEAIRASSVFILAISRHSTGSKNVVKELALASEREKIILPIYLEQCDIPETMEYQLAGIQNIALYTLDKGKAYEFVHQTIRRLGVGRPSNCPSGKPRPGAGHGTGVGHGHMAPPKAKGGPGKRIAWPPRWSCVAGFLLSQGGDEALPRRTPHPEHTRDHKGIPTNKTPIASPCCRSRSTPPRTTSGSAAGWTTNSRPHSTRLMASPSSPAFR